MPQAPDQDIIRCLDINANADVVILRDSNEFNSGYPLWDVWDWF